MTERARYEFKPPPRAGDRVAGSISDLRLRATEGDQEALQTLVNRTAALRRHQGLSPLPDEKLAQNELRQAGVVVEETNDPTSGDWTEKAACRNADPEALFVQGTEQNRAKAICRGCPVRVECLDDALDNRIEFGVWGGMTERERREILRKRDSGK